MKEVLKSLNEESIESICLFSIYHVYSEEQLLDFYVDEVKVEGNFHCIYINNYLTPSKKMLVKVNKLNKQTNIYIDANGWKDTEIEINLKELFEETSKLALFNQKKKLIEEKYKNGIVIERAE